MSTWGSKIQSRAQTPSLGMKKLKLRAEKPCRTPVSEFQTEPYSESYGRKPFWRVPAKILKYLRGKFLSSKREFLFSRREILYSKREILHSTRGILHSKRETLHARRETLHARREILHSRKGKSCIQERDSQWDHGTRDHGAASE